MKSLWARSMASARVRYLSFFGGLLVIFYVCSATIWWNQVLYQYLAANARLSGAILNAMGRNTVVEGLVISSGEFSIAVRKGCDGVEPGWFFASAVLAFPAAPAKKVTGILCGVTLLLALNLLRIVSLYFIGAFHKSAFETAHLEIWPALFILAAIILWMLWLRWIKHGTKADGC